jgi:transposase-like protein
MRKKRHNYTPEENVAILKRYLVERVPVSDLCDQYHLQPTVFYHWQQQFFENVTAAFTQGKNPKRQETRRIQQLEQKLQKKQQQHKKVRRDAGCSASQRTTRIYQRSG